MSNQFYTAQNKLARSGGGSRKFFHDDRESQRTKRLLSCFYQTKDAEELKPVNLRYNEMNIINFRFNEDENENIEEDDSKKEISYDLFYPPPPSLLRKKLISQLIEYSSMEDEDQIKNSNVETEENVRINKSTCANSRPDEIEMEGKNGIMASKHNAASNQEISNGFKTFNESDDISNIKRRENHNNIKNIQVENDGNDYDSSDDNDEMVDVTTNDEDNDEPIIVYDEGYSNFYEKNRYLEETTKNDREENGKENNDNFNAIGDMDDKWSNSMDKGKKVSNIDNIQKKTNENQTLNDDINHKPENDSYNDGRDNLMDEKNTTITVKQQPKLKKNKESNDRNGSNECNEHITCIIDDDDINDIDSSDDEGAFNFAAKPSKSSTNLAAETKTATITIPTITITTTATNPNPLKTPEIKPTAENTKQNQPIQNKGESETKYQVTTATNNSSVIYNNNTKYDIKNKQNSNNITTKHTRKKHKNSITTISCHNPSDFTPCNPPMISLIQKEDPVFLTGLDCMIRDHFLEYFIGTEIHMTIMKEDGNPYLMNVFKERKISIIGLRCKHCVASHPHHRPKLDSFIFPTSIVHLCGSAWKVMIDHVQTCPKVPKQLMHLWNWQMATCNSKTCKTNSNKAGTGAEFQFQHKIPIYLSDEHKYWMDCATKRNNLRSYRGICVQYVEADSKNNPKLPPAESKHLESLPKLKTFQDHNLNADIEEDDDIDDNNSYHFNNFNFEDEKNLPSVPQSDKSLYTKENFCFFLIRQFIPCVYSSADKFCGLLVGYPGFACLHCDVRPTSTTNETSRFFPQSLHQLIHYHFFHQFYNHLRYCPRFHTFSKEILIEHRKRYFAGSAQSNPLHKNKHQIRSFLSGIWYTMHKPFSISEYKNIDGTEVSADDGGKAKTSIEQTRKILANDSTALSGTTTNPSWGDKPSTNYPILSGSSTPANLMLKVSPNTNNTIDKSFSSPNEENKKDDKLGTTNGVSSAANASGSIRVGGIAHLPNNHANSGNVNINQSFEPTRQMIYNQLQYNQMQYKQIVNAKRNIHHNNSIRQTPPALGNDHKCIDLTNDDKLPSNL